MKRGLVVKVGGSLMDNPAALRQSVEALLDNASDIAIVNGSGSLRHQQKAWLREADAPIDPEKDLALLHQQRLIGSHLLSCLDSRLVVATNESDIYRAWEGSKSPIVVATHVIPETSKRMGADTAAAHLCKMLGVRSLIKMTNVGGVNDESGVTIPQLSYDQLEAMGQTCVDEGTAPVLRKNKTECFVVDGYDADNLTHLLSGKSFNGTLVTEGE